MCPVLIQSTEPDAHAARFNAKFRSVLASTHFGETATADATAPSFKTSRLVQCPIFSVSFFALEQYAWEVRRARQN
jgi:hypothetical protein